MTCGSGPPQARYLADNYTEFFGAELAQMLIDHNSQLPETLLTSIRVGLGHAAWAVFRRDTGPAYTNISILGAMATLCNERLLQLARDPAVQKDAG